MIANVDCLPVNGGSGWLCNAIFTHSLQDPITVPRRRYPALALLNQLFQPGHFAELELCFACCRGVNKSL